MTRQRLTQLIKTDTKTFEDVYTGMWNRGNSVRSIDDLFDWTYLGGRHG